MPLAVARIAATTSTPAVDACGRLSRSPHSASVVPSPRAVARRHRTAHRVAMTANATTSSSGMTIEEKFAFDLRGFIVVKNVFDAGEVAAMNAAIDARASEIVERKGRLRLGGEAGDPLAGDGSTGRADLGGMLTWNTNGDADVFRSVLAHEKLVPYYHELVGVGYRMDHLPLMIQQKTGADGFVFHGGKMNPDGSWCQELAYTYEQGKMYNQLLAVSVALSDTAPGDGGFAIVPGSHKSNFACPQAILEYKSNQDLVVNPEIKAGDVLLFTEAATHGTMAWTAKHTRRAVLYRFAPSTYAYGRSYYPTWPEGTEEGMTDAQKAVLQPPHHVRLDRTTLTDSGAVAGTQTRDDFKKEHDAKVFGNKYF